MNLITRVLLVFLLLAFIACRDAKKEEEETKAALSKIENIESQVNDISEEVDTQANEMESALKELDSI
ncbi:hypothetical protein [Snuella sedimenti]|uniref:Uncharacterized protein n=1 Tax=Snuella sedimenti TaxID=2798802 RepID=A0A8J7J3X7_9FLAO|nr:hypothetical protein [Snuella sedimenti]MBJ6369382.1 hypothetical protein [Snuella sedimenti]